MLARSSKRRSPVRIGKRLLHPLWPMLLTVILVVAIMFVSRWCWLRCHALDKYTDIDKVKQFKPLGLVIETLVKQWWQEGDPQICVVVSSNTKDKVKLTAMVSSLLSTAYPYIDVILFDASQRSTIAVPDWLNEVATMLNARSSVQDRRPVVHVSARSQARTTAEYPRMTTPDYGFLTIDLILKDLWSRQLVGVPECEYYMLADGEDLYSSNLIPITLEHLRSKIAVIGWWYTRSDTSDRNKPDQVIETKFSTGDVHKGAALINMKHVMWLKMHYYMSNGQDSPYISKIGMGISTAVLGGNFLMELAEKQHDKSIVLDRIFLMVTS